MGNLERYGLCALVFVTTMGLAVSIWGPSGEPGRLEPTTRLAAAPPRAADAAPLTRPKRDATPRRKSIDELFQPVAQTQRKEHLDVAPAAASATRETASSGRRTHVVAAGETLGGIALTLMGSSHHWEAISAANGDLDPTALQVGQRLVIPALNRKTGKPVPAVLKAAAGTIVTVRDGDSLSAIAKRELGDMNRWQDIFDANRDVLNDPGALQIGMRLRMP